MHEYDIIRGHRWYLRNGTIGDGKVESPGQQLPVYTGERSPLKALINYFLKI